MHSYTDKIHLKPGWKTEYTSKLGQAKVTINQTFDVFKLKCAKFSSP